jgi:hypothetical protein
MAIFSSHPESEKLAKCIPYGNDLFDPRTGPNRRLMIDLLLQLAYVALALAVISLFVCTLPVWLIVLVVVLVLR